MSRLGALLKKDLLLELRTRESLAVLVTLAILLSVICAAGAQSLFVDRATLERLFAVNLWLVFVFSATVSMGRSLEHETEHMGIEGVLLAGVPPPLLFVSRFLSNSVLILAGHLVAVGALAILMDVQILSLLGELAIVSLLTLIAYAALATVLVGLAVTSRLRGLLLPLILLPLLFPLFFAAVELTLTVLTTGTLDPASPWLSLLVVLDVVYVVAGLNLYGFVLRE